jgi:membrane associated rhomboid family serine protease
MIIVPLTTDAPIYHWPRATVGLIVANVAVFVAEMTATDRSVFEPYLLATGQGLHPLQWLTHNFLHADILHLVGNMIFLWAYGIVVEGKIGWLPFLLVYLGIGTAHGAVIQAAYLGASEPGVVLGASAIIFGLMAMAMIWAPVNDLTCFYFVMFGFRIFTNIRQIPIWVFALLQIVLQIGGMTAAWVLRGDPMSSGLLHLSGLLWGLVVGIAMVKLGLVDCEGYDVFSLRSKRRSLKASWKARERRLDLSRENDRPARNLVRDDLTRPGETPEQRAGKTLRRLNEAIGSGDAAGVEAAFRKWNEACAGKPPRAELLAAIKALHAAELGVASVPLMRALCRIYPAGSEKVRLKLAAILVRQMSRPTEARRHLDQIGAGSLDVTLSALRRRLIEEADAQIEDGVLELEEEGA